VLRTPAWSRVLRTPVGTSRLRIQICYLWRHRRLARLGQPQLLTEWIQHRKLHDRDPRLPILADKVQAKIEVAAALGERWIVPTLWRGSVLPDVPAWPFPYVVKSRHGSQQVQIVRNEADHRIAVTRSRAWMKSGYGAWLDEWLYSEIPRGLLVEPFIGTGDALPVDYKLFVFGGRVSHVQVHLDRAGMHRWIVFDRQWRRASPATPDPDPPPPATLAQMIVAAERLGAGFPFVRADFYEVGGQPLFGELTFYPGSGLEHVEPAALDLEMGCLWAAALATDQDVPRLQLAG
jgi:hypothetical protein